MEEKIKGLEDQIAGIQHIYLDVFKKHYEITGVEEAIKELDEKTNKLND